MRDGKTYCATHRAQRQKESDRRRAARERERGVSRVRGREGREIAARVLRAANGLCAACAARGITQLAAEVDHIVPLWAGGAESDENRQALCRACHRAKTARDAAAHRGQ